MQMMEERRKSKDEITTELFFRCKVHVYSWWARLSPYFEHYFVDATGDGGAVYVSLLMHHIDFSCEYLVAPGFFLGVLALLGPMLCELSFHFRRSSSNGSISTYSTLIDPH
jgi:hypothetical protein